MAKGDVTQPIKAGGRAPSYRGTLMIDVSRGQIRIRKWPRPRGQNRPEIQKWWSEWLRQAMALMKFAPPREIQLWRDAVAGTPVKLSDIYLASMRGTLWVLEGPDGQQYWPEQAIEKVSSSLDLITSQPGGMIVRGNQQWQGIAPPASINEVLIASNDELPQWLSLSAAGIATAPIGATATRSTTQTMTRLTFDPVTFTDAQLEPDGTNVWDPTEPTRLTAAVNGWHNISSYIRWSSIPSMIVSYRLRINDTDVVASNSTQVGETGNSNTHMNLAASLYLEAGDYMTVELWQNSLSDQNISTARATLVSI